MMARLLIYKDLLSTTYPSILSISGFKSSSAPQAAPPSPRQLTAAEAEAEAKNQCQPSNACSLLAPTAVILRVPGPAVVIRGAAGVAIVVAAYIHPLNQLYHGPAAVLRW